MNQRRKGIVLGYVYIIVQTVVTLAYTPLLLKGIGQAEYGLYQIVGSIAAYMTIIESMLTSSAIRFFCAAKAKDDHGEMSATLGVARLLYRGASILVAFLGVFATFLFVIAYSSSMTGGELQEGIFLLIVLFANIIMNMLNYTTSVIISSFERFVFLKLADLISVICQPLVVLLVINSYPYALTITVVQFVVSAIFWICKRLYADKTIGIKPAGRHYSWLEVKPLLTFSATIAIAMVADIIFAKTDQLIIGGIIGTSAVAVYSVGYQIYSCYSSLGTVVTSMFIPHLSELATREDALIRFSELWTKTGRMAYFIITAILLGFIFFGMEFIYLWVGEGYEAAYWVGLLMMAAYYIDIIQKLSLSILQVLNRYSFRAAVYVGSALANIVLTLIFTNLFGIIGAALSSAVVLFAGSGLIMNVYYKKVIGLDVRYFWLQIAKATRGIPLLIVGALLIQHIEVAGNFPTFMVHVLSFAVLYVAYAFVSMNVDEKALVKSLMKGGIR